MGLWNTLMSTDCAQNLPEIRVQYGVCFSATKTKRLISLWWYIYKFILLHKNLHLVAQLRDVSALQLQQLLQHVDLLGLLPDEKVETLGFFLAPLELWSYLTPCSLTLITGARRWGLNPVGPGITPVSPFRITRAPHFGWSRGFHISHKIPEVQDYGFGCSVWLARAS